MWCCSTTDASRISTDRKARTMDVRRDDVVGLHLPVHDVLGFHAVGRLNAAYAPPPRSRNRHSVETTLA